MPAPACCRTGRSAAFHLLPHKFNRSVPERYGDRSGQDHLSIFFYNTESRSIALAGIPFFGEICSLKNIALNALINGIQGALLNDDGQMIPRLSLPIAFGQTQDNIVR